jgi:hypothetical protein
MTSLGAEPDRSDQGFENLRFIEETRMIEETRKFIIEQRKLMAETDRLVRDWRYAPFVLVASGIGSGAALVAAGAGLFAALLGYAHAMR